MASQNNTIDIPLAAEISLMDKFAFCYACSRSVRSATALALYYAVCENLL